MILIKRIPAGFDWTITRGDVRSSVITRKSTAPGPGGISFSCYKACSDLATDILHDCIVDLTGGNVFCIPAKYDDILLFYLPKKPSSYRNEDETQPFFFFLPKCLRPLSISCVAVRLISNSLRRVISRAADLCISSNQVGYMKGRHIDTRIRDVLSTFWDNVKKRKKIITVLIDFEAALTKWGFPPGWVRGVERLIFRALII